MKALELSCFLRSRLADNPRLSTWAVRLSHGGRENVELFRRGVTAVEVFQFKQHLIGKLKAGGLCRQGSEPLT